MSLSVIMPSWFSTRVPHAPKMSRVYQSSGVPQTVRSVIHSPRRVSTRGMKPVSARKSRPRSSKVPSQNQSREAWT